MKIIAATFFICSLLFKFAVHKLDRSCIFCAVCSSAKQIKHAPRRFYCIQLSRSLTEDVSGVQSALQGKREGNTSGVMYQAQITQAAASILDLIRTFNSFLTKTALKSLIPYDLDTIHDVDLDVSISDDTDSPVYRALLNQFLIAAVDKGQLPFRVALEVGNFPNSSKLIAAYDRFQQEMARQQTAMQGVQPQ